MCAFASTMSLPSKHCHVNATLDIALVVFLTTSTQSGEKFVSWLTIDYMFLLLSIIPCCVAYLDRCHF